MNQPKELEWRRLFANALPERKKTVKAKCTCGNGNCKHAKRIRCVCGCGGIAHGIENRKGMSPLDKTLGLDKTGIEILASQPEVLRLDPLVSRELIYIG